MKGGKLIEETQSNFFEETRSSFFKLDLKAQPVSRRRRAVHNSGEWVAGERRLNEEDEGGRSF
jgi:hypothetical protein